MLPRAPTDQIRSRCLAVLSSCEEFSSHDKLLAVFSVEPLNAYSSKLPECSSQHERVLGCIRYLFDKQNNGEWVFVLFLRQLSSFYPSGDLRREQLEQLTSEVLSSLPATTPVEQRQQQAETIALLADLQQYGQQRRQGQQDSDDLAAEWLEVAGQDTDEWAFRIALALFDGGHYTAFFAAYQDLAVRLRPASERPEQDNPGQTAIPRPVGARLRNAGAARREEPENLAAPALGTTRRVLLEHGTLGYVALRYVWEEYEAWHPQLIAWLTALAASRQVEVRNRIAVATGLLAVDCFSSISSELLLLWAQHNTAEYRAAVGKALGVAAADQRRRDEVRTLLARWSTSKDGALRWTAMRAYIYVGRHLAVNEVLAQWRQIAAAEPMILHVEAGSNLYVYFANPLHRSLCNAVTTFFLNLTLQPENRQQLVSATAKALHEWVEADQRSAKVGELGLPLFLALADAVLPDDPFPPLLMRLVEPGVGGAEYRTTLAKLLFVALRHPVLQDTGWEMLRQWCRYIDEDHLVDGARLEALLRDLAAQDARGRLRERLVFYLERWGKLHRPPIPWALQAREALLHAL